MAMGMGSIVRLLYDALKKIANSFRGQEASVGQTIQKIQSAYDTLKNGDWVGEGASAFFNEMEGEVMPAMKRLQNALTEADRVAKEIERIQRETEQTVLGIMRNIPGFDLSG